MWDRIREREGIRAVSFFPRQVVTKPSGAYFKRSRAQSKHTRTGES